MHEQRKSVSIFGHCPRLVRPRHHNQVVTVGKLVLHVPEALTQEPFDAVTADGVTDLSRHADAQTRIPQIIFGNVKPQRPIEGATTQGKNALEIRAFTEPLPLFEAEPLSG